MNNVSVSAGLRVAISAAGRILLAAILLITPAAVADSAPAGGPAPTQDFQQPAGSHFVVENVGQFAGEARFLLRQGDQRIWLADDSVWLTVPDPLTDSGRSTPEVDSERPLGRARHPAAVARSGTAIRFRFQGADPTAAIEPFNRVSTHVSYLIGDNPANWRQDVPVWSGVRYRGLYPGVDLVIGDGAVGTVPWRLEAQAGADLNAVTLRVEGADSVTAAAGDLRLEMKGQAVNLALPGWSLSGQADSSGSTAVQLAGEAAFTLTPGTEPRTGSELNAGAAGVTALDDLIYNTPLAGGLYDVGYAIAADAQGNTYITGETASSDLPFTAGAYDQTNNGIVDPTEAFVAKFDPNGGVLPVYLTYLGGDDLDIGWGIAVSGGIAFVAGETKSTNFPGMIQPVLGTDAFVAALNATGTDVRYVSRVGGLEYDAAFAIAAEGLEAYLVGTTQSTTVCATSADGDLLVAKLNTLGAQVYATCIDSSDPEAGYAIAVRNGEAFVAGDTWPATSRDIIVGHVSTGGAINGGGIFGGTADDTSNGIAVDAFGSIYVAGTTWSSADFPVTTLPAAPWGGGDTDAVVMQMHRNGTAMDLDFATYLGGESDDSAYGIAVDTVQGLYVAGTTTSAVFPMTAGVAYDETFNGVSDVFVARMHLGATSTAPDKVTYATYLGAANEDWGGAVATDTGGHAYVTGSSATSADWDSANAFVAKLKVSSPLAAPALTITRSGTSALLEWGNTAPRFQVFQSDRPYFMPGDWSSLAPIADNAAIFYLDNNALNVVDARYYVVKAVDATPAASENSNRVGKFTYPLVKGN